MPESTCRDDAHGRAFRVLVAEDDAEMRRLVSDALRADGFDVCEASDGGRLLIITDPTNAEERLDLIISDIRMPICSGLRVLENLRRAHRPIPVILMTAFGDDDTRAKASHLGALLLDKPFTVGDLRSAVRKILPMQ
jgi:DNA-binding response OmpR family regulator